jgi:hypothetical protein
MVIVNIINIPQYGDYNSTPVFYLKSNLGSNFFVQKMINDNNQVKDIMINMNIFRRIINSFLSNFPISFVGGDYKNDSYTSSLTSSGFIE